MPHLTIEYSANLKSETDFNVLCKKLLSSLLETGLFEIGAPRIRAIACDDYAITDQHEKNAFIDMSLRVGKGRSQQDLKSAGDAIYQTAREVLSEKFDSPYFALSFEIREIDPVLSWKTNAMHPRLRKTNTAGS